MSTNSTDAPGNGRTLPVERMVVGDSPYGFRLEEPVVGRVRLRSQAAAAFYEALAHPDVTDQQLREAERATLVESATVNRRQQLFELNQTIQELGFEITTNEHLHTADDLEKYKHQAVEIGGLYDALLGADITLPPSQFGDPATIRHDLVAWMASLPHGIRVDIDPDGAIRTSSWDRTQLAPAFADTTGEVRKAIISGLDQINFHQVFTDDDLGAPGLDELYAAIDTAVEAAIQELDHRRHAAVTTCRDAAAWARHKGVLIDGVRYAQLGHEIATAAPVDGISPGSLAAEPVGRITAAERAITRPSATRDATPAAPAPRPVAEYGR